jgi:hypothetical protein
MRYCSIDIDFDVFKAITAARQNAGTSENDVLRKLLGLGSPDVTGDDSPQSTPATQVWTSEGVDFPVGLKLQHRFRDGRLAEAKITRKGVEYNGQAYGGLSPAAAAASGHQANGWQFWEMETRAGWRKADALRR